MDRPKVLLTEGSSLSARHTLFSLGRQHVIDVVDPKIFVLGRASWFVRKWFLCPSFFDESVEYLQFIAQKIAEHKYDVLLPTHDQVFLLARFRDEFSPHVGLALPDFTTIERLQSKAEFTRLLDELDLPQPATQIVRTREQLERPWEFPCWVKTAHSTAGRGVRLVNNAEDLARLSDDWQSGGQWTGQSEILIQQPAKGIQATVQAVFQHGRLVAAHSLEARAIGVGGMASARVGVHRPDVVEHVSRLGEHLDWHGAMFLDYFYDAENCRPEYIEANPRIGETINATLSGVNLCELLVKVSMGEHVPTVPSPEPGLRSHSGFMILMTEAMNGGNRRRLLSEWIRARLGKDIYENSEDELARLGDDPLSLIASGVVGMKLLASPRSSNGIVERTVNNYALPADAVSVIRQLPDGTVMDCFDNA